MLWAFEAAERPWYVSFVFASGGAGVDHESDGALVRRSSARGGGAPAAEQAFCGRFAPRIRLYGLRHLRSEERAQDLIQAVLLAVIQAAREGRVQEPDHVERFVLGTCRHVARRMKEADYKAIPVPDDDLVRAAGAVEPRVTDAGALIRCLRALDERAQRVVLMTFRDDLPAEQVATSLEITAGNVRVVRHRALTSLRRCLEGSAA